MEASVSGAKRREWENDPILKTLKRVIPFTPFPTKDQYGLRGAKPNGTGGFVKVQLGESLMHFGSRLFHACKNWENRSCGMPAHSSFTLWQVQIPDGFIIAY